MPAANQQRAGVIAPAVVLAQRRVACTEVNQIRLQFSVFMDTAVEDRMLAADRVILVFGVEGTGANAHADKHQRQQRAGTGAF